MKSLDRLIILAVCVGLWIPASADAQRGIDLARTSPLETSGEREACDAASSTIERAFPCRRGETARGALLLPDGTMEIIHYELIDGVGVVESDILLRVDEEGEIEQGVPGPDRFEGKSTGRSSTFYRWSGANIPFVNSLTYNRQRVDDAIAHWESVTNLRFVPRTTEDDYVDFVPAAGCASYVGRQGDRQEISLADGCSKGNTIHEIGHAVGLWHEHNRSDRDNAVTIHWQNIDTTECPTHAFETYVQRGQDGFDWGAHDFGSVMHYYSYACSLNMSPTITKTDGSTFGSQRIGLSPGDISGVDRMYGLRVTASYWCTEYSRECHFNAYVTQGPTSIQSWEWFFDDTPQTQFGQAVDHTFSSYGWHHVEVEVLDDRGGRAVATIDLFLDENETCIVCT